MFALPALAAAAAVIAASPRPARAQDAPPRAAADSAVAERTVRAFVEAYNRHDVDALLALADSEVVWLTVSGDTVGIEARGRAALGESLRGYFRSLPSARSTAEALTVLGPWVTVRERAHWLGRDGVSRSQAAISVYEVRAGRVRRVWYYPAVR
jgi:ketosteroid isomerase-like protein